MTQPLNYAILLYYADAHEASVNDVMRALEPEYRDHKAFKKESITESVMTAEKNDLLHETHYGLDENGELEIFYQASPEQQERINQYLA